MPGEPVRIPITSLWTRDPAWTIKPAAVRQAPWVLFLAKDTGLARTLRSTSENNPVLDPRPATNKALELPLETTVALVRTPA